MKTYAVYSMIIEEGENIFDRFQEIVKAQDYNIDTFYHKTPQIAFKGNKDALLRDMPNVASVIFERDNSTEPNKYRIVPKEEIFSDFPECKTLKKIKT